jgi:hypothetical protein
MEKKKNKKMNNLGHSLHFGSPNMKALLFCPNQLVFPPKSCHVN